MNNTFESAGVPVQELNGSKDAYVDPFAAVALLLTGILAAGATKVRSRQPKETPALDDLPPMLKRLRD